MGSGFIYNLILALFFYRLFKTGIMAKNTFNFVEWNILLVLYFRFERHFLFFLFKHKKEKGEMGKEGGGSVGEGRNRKGCEGKTDVTAASHCGSFLSGRYAVTSSLLTFDFFF